MNTYIFSTVRHLIFSLLKSGNEPEQQHNILFFSDHQSTSMDAWKQKLFNTLAPTGTIWNGHNASGWKSDIVAANGFDIRMQYGGQDRELGERLFNAGIKSKRIRYSAVCVHLDRSRGFTPQESKDKNHAIRDNAKNNKVVRTDYGITELRSN